MKPITAKDNNLPIFNYIAVPIRFENFEQCQKDFDSAIQEKADLIEIRFDYSELVKEKAVELSEFSSKNYFKIHSKDLDIQLNQYAEEIFPKKKISELRKRTQIPVIFTLRSKEQGGNTDIPEPVRIYFIRYLMQFKPDYFDLETSIEYDQLLKLTKYAKKQNISIIYSHHDGIRTPSEVLIKKIADNILKKFPDLTASIEHDKVMKKIENVKKLHSKPDILKLIFTAKKIRDNITTLNICKFYAKKGIKIVCFCMGDLGLSSRVGSILSGAYFSFASIGEMTAPGQINIKKFRETLNSS